MQEAVDERDSAGGVREDFGPLGEKLLVLSTIERAVAAACDDLEEQAGYWSAADG